MNGEMLGGQLGSDGADGVQLFVRSEDIVFAEEGWEEFWVALGEEGGGTTPKRMRWSWRLAGAGMSRWRCL